MSIYEISDYSGSDLESDSDSDTSPIHSNPTTPTPTQTFPLAHPPPRSRSSQCLRLTSQLLLQIQQLTPPTASAAAKSSSSAVPPAARAIPILELYQPSRLGKSIADGRKLHSHDMYLTQSEPYTHLKKLARPGKKEADPTTNSKSGTKKRGRGRRSTPSSSTTTGTGQDTADNEKDKHDYGDGDDLSNDAVVAVIYNSPKRTSKKNNSATVSGGSGTTASRRSSSSTSTGSTNNNNPTSTPLSAELYFPKCQRIWNTWEASIPAPGRYRFQPKQMPPEDNEKTKKANCKSTPNTTTASGSGSGSSANSTSSYLVVEWEKRSPRSRGSDTANGTHHHSPLMSMTEKEHGREEGLFVLSIADPPELRRPWLAQLTKRGVQVGGWDQWQRDQLRAAGVDEDAAGLYTWILTMGVWVAREEGWL